MYFTSENMLRKINIIFKKRKQLQKDELPQKIWRKKYPRRQTSRRISWEIPKWVTEACQENYCLQIFLGKTKQRQNEMQQKSISLCTFKSPKKCSTRIKLRSRTKKRLRQRFLKLFIRTVQTLMKWKNPSSLFYPITFKSFGLRPQRPP